MKKYKKVVNILTGLFTIVLFVYMCIGYVKIPSNENKELLMKYCDEVAYSFDGSSVEAEGYDVRLSVEREEVMVHIKDEVEYNVIAKYPIISSNYEGETKTFKIDLDKATYTEQLGNDSSYSTGGKILLVVLDVMTVIIASCLFGMAFWCFFAGVIGSIIESIIKKKKRKENK